MASLCPKFAEFEHPPRAVPRGDTDVSTSTPILYDDGAIASPSSPSTTKRFPELVLIPQQRSMTILSFLKSLNGRSRKPISSSSATPEHPLGESLDSSMSFSPPATGSDSDSLSPSSCAPPSLARRCALIVAQRVAPRLLLKRPRDNAMASTLIFRRVTKAHRTSLSTKPRVPCCSINTPSSSSVSSAKSSVSLQAFSEITL